MTEALTFILRFIIFALFHSLAATDRCKQLCAGNSGCEPRWYRLGYNLLSIMLFIFVMAAWRNSTVLYFVPGAGSLVMYLLQLVIAALILHCLCKTGFTDFIGISHGTSGGGLVEDGYYGVVRHPLYLLSLLFMLLNPVMSAQWLTFTVCSLAYFIIGAIIEERRLMRRFGSVYERYRQRVPFFVPRIRAGQNN